MRLVFLISVFFAATALAKDEAPNDHMSCDVYASDLDFFQSIDCEAPVGHNPPPYNTLGPADCKRQRKMNILNTQQAWDVYCESNSATPSSSEAPSFAVKSGCGCLDNGEYFNTLVFDNFDGSSDCQGRLAIGGNASMSGFSVGDKLAESYGKKDYLIVGGHLSYISGRVYGGNIVYGAEDPEFGDAVLHGLVKDNHKRLQTDRVDFAALETYYQGLSTSLCALTDTADIIVEGGAAVTTRSNSEVEVLSMTCEELNGVGSIDLGGISESQTVVLNVRGDECEFQVEQIVANPAFVLWNFCEASRVGIESVGVQGSILAPFADAVSNSGVIFGQSVVKSWTGHAQQNNVNCVACLPGTTTGVLHPSTFF